jgi:HPt (histidine-containing phosphotransfer) domain-containing protein
MGTAVDFGYLESFAAGDAGVVREVLQLFLEQARTWDAGLTAADPAAFRDLAHNIKGTSRGIGAGALGDLAAAAEHEGPGRASALRAALAEAVAEVEAYLAG